MQKLVLLLTELLCNGFFNNPFSTQEREKSLVIAMNVKEEIASVIGGKSSTSSNEQSDTCSGDEGVEKMKPWKNEVSSFQIVSNKNKAKETKENNY